MIKKIFGWFLIIPSILFIGAGVSLLTDRDIGAGILGIIIGLVTFSGAMALLRQRGKSPKKEEKSIENTHERSLREYGENESVRRESVKLTESMDDISDRNDIVDIQPVQSRYIEVSKKVDTESTIKSSSTEGSLQRINDHVQDEFYERTTTELIIENLPGVSLHIYNISEETAETVTNLISDYIHLWNYGPTALMVLPSRIGIWHETLSLLMAEDIRCKELDDYVQTHKDLYFRYKNDPSYPLFDEYPGVKWVPHNVNLDMVFEYPSQRANEIRSLIVNHLKLPPKTLEYYFEVMGRILEPDSHFVSYYREDFDVLFKRQLIVPIKDAPIDQILKNRLKMSELRELAKNLGVSIKARKKELFVEELTLSVPEQRIRAEISHILNKKEYFVKPVDIVSKDEMEWFQSYISTLNTMIFGTLESKVNTALYILMQTHVLDHSDEFAIVGSQDSCKLCKAYDGRSFFATQKLKKRKTILPPFHLGCRCRVI